MNSTWCRALAPAAVLFAALSPAAAQQPPAPQPAQNPYCGRLETQLQTFDRGNPDAARQDQLRKLEESANTQQNEVTRQEAASKRMGCEQNSFFVLFTNQPQQCGPLNNKIQQMQAALEQTRSNIERLQGDPPPEREGQRRAILTALVQNNCGPQYQAALGTEQPRSGGGSLFESLFGSKPPAVAPGGDIGGFSPAGNYRTVCVRTCDGFYYPISNSASPTRFAEDEKLCRQSCPATEAVLYAFRSPGGDINQAMSVSGQPYTALPNAFRYRQAVDSSCSCRRPGESWQQTLKNIEDSTVEQGDITVNEQRARQMSQPRVDPQSKPIRPEPPRPTTAKPDPNPAQAAAPVPAAQPAAVANDTPAAEPPDKPDPNRPVRSVGPVFIPRAKSN